MSLDFIPKSTF